MAEVLLAILVVLLIAGVVYAGPRLPRPWPALLWVVVLVIALLALFNAVGAD